MLDMSFQLLAFFVITFRAASATEGQLDMYLPRVQEARAKDPTQIDTSKETSAEPDDAADVTVSLTATSAGDLLAITVREKVEKAFLGASVPEMCTALREYLNTVRAAGGNQNSIRIESAAQLKYSRVVDVMDACLAAGYRQVGFARPPDLGNMNR
jgi:biopolymer transport protein ExbD